MGAVFGKRKYSHAQKAKDRQMDTFGRLLKSGHASKSFRGDSHHSENPYYETAQADLIDSLPFGKETDDEKKHKRQLVHKFYSKALGWRAGSVDMKRRGMWFKVVAIILGALVPFLISITLIIADKQIIKLLDVGAIILSILAMVLTTVIDEFKWKRKGQIQERTADALVAVINAYVALSGPLYAKKKRAAPKVSLAELRAVPAFMLEAALAEKKKKTLKPASADDHGGANFKKFCQKFIDVEQQGIEALDQLFDVPAIFEKQPVGTPAAPDATYDEEAESDEENATEKS